jgi:CheY-like chemotaxis protein
LVVDDDPVARTLLQQMLADYDTQVACDGAQALALIANAAPSVIVSDVEMPHMGGLVLARILKRDSRLRHIPLLLITADNGEGRVVECLEAGADDYLSKPVKAAELKARVKAAVRASLMTAELSRTALELARTKSELSATLDGMTDAVVSYDTAGRVRTWNAAATGLFPILTQQSSLRTLDLIPANDVWAPDNNSSSVGKELTIGELEEQLTLEVRVRRVDPHYFVAVLRDLTWRRRTQEVLCETENRLLDAERTAGAAEVATGTLHNVGNVLSSLNVCVGSLENALDANILFRFARLSALLADKQPLMEASMGREGSLIPAYCASLNEALKGCQERIASEVTGLQQHLRHLKAVVSNQQRFAMGKDGRTEVEVAALMRTAATLSGVAPQYLTFHTRVNVVFLDEHRVLEILVNLIRNALDAVAKVPIPQIAVRCLTQAGSIVFRVEDNGHGVEPAVVSKLFQHGFTTKQGGHGFGLHYCASSARQMGGMLRAHSAGTGAGAMFELTLPLEGETPRLFDVTVAPPVLLASSGEEG